MFAALGVILLVVWLLGFLVLHAAGALIHLLIVIAIIAFIMHVVRGRRTPAP